MMKNTYAFPGTCCLNLRHVPGLWRQSLVHSCTLPYHLTTLSPRQLATLPPCHLATWLPCHVATLPRCSVQREAYFNFRDGIENICLSISCFETGSRISFFQSHASRRDRDFITFSLVLRDENGNFFLSISCFETSTRIFPPNLRLRDESKKSRLVSSLFIFSLKIH